MHDLASVSGLQVAGGPMRYHPLYEGFWTEEKLEGTPPDERLFAAYLFSNPRVRPSGIYRVTDEQAAADVRLPVRRAMALFQDLTTRHFILRDHGWVFVLGYFRLQPKQPFLIRGAHRDVTECSSASILELWGQRYPRFKQWSVNRLATIAQPLPEGTVIRTTIVGGLPDSNAYALTTLSGSPEREPDRVPLRQQARDILAFLNQQAHKSFRDSPPNLKLIEARLASGMTPANLRGIVARKVRTWAKDPKMAQFLRPATLFSATNAEQYLGERDPDA